MRCENIVRREWFQSVSRFAAKTLESLSYVGTTLLGALIPSSKSAANNVKLRERILMLHNPINATVAGGPYVTLSSPEMAVRAIKELDKAPLFDRRVQLKLFDLRNLERKDVFPETGWGWFATPESDLWHIQQRPPHWEPPQNIFASMRECRRVILDDLPSPDLLTYPRVQSEIYRMLHNFNVLGLANTRGYQPKGSKTTN
jgi:hypothetical protein